MTKGGKFLPGHDAKYLTILRGMPADQADRLAAGVSPTYAAKLKRMREGGR